MVAVMGGGRAGGLCHGQAVVESGEVAADVVAARAALELV